MNKIDSGHAGLDIITWPGQVNSVFWQVECLSSWVILELIK